MGASVGSGFGRSLGQGLADEALQQRQHQRCVGGNLGSQLARCLQFLTKRHDPVDQSDFVGAPGVDAAADQ